MTNAGGEPHKPGDVVNGHVMTSGGQWVPLHAPKVPEPPAPPAPPYGLGEPTWPPNQTIYVQADNSNNSSLAPVTSLITGLIGLFLSWIPIIGIVGWLFGPLALIFGVIGARRGRSEHKIMSWIGIACGTLTLLICGVYLVAFISAVSKDS
jgi:hypothetical protein